MAREPVFINVGRFREYFTKFRKLSIEGELGSGKTLLSVAMARWLWKEGFVDGVFANFPIDPTFVPIVHTCVRSCIILDEAWAFADSRSSANQFEGYGAYVRKLKSFFIAPSIFKPDKRMRDMLAERTIDLWMLDWWFYKWFDIREREGWFILANPQSVYGFFDTEFIPVDDGGIHDTLMNELAELAGSTRAIESPVRSRLKVVAGVKSR